MRRIGLTGGIACGKSTVCGFFAALGAGIIDADAVAREVVQPGEEAYQKIVEVFGPAILDDDQAINRQVLGDLIFQSDDLRRKLNEITHPIIIRRTDHMLEKMSGEGNHPVAIVDAALMVEAGSFERFEKLIVVWCTEQQQIERIRGRSNLSVSEALQRIRAQMPLAEKRKFADFEVDTSGTLDSVRQQTERIYLKLIGEAMKLS